MKKIKVILLYMCLFIIVFSFFGCNNSFTNVKSVEYTANGQKMRYASQVVITHSFPLSIDKNEVDDNKLLNKFENTYEIDYNNSNTKLYKLGDSIYYTNGRFDEYCEYYKTTIEKIDIQYVGIKIKKDKSIEIRTPDGSVIVVATDSYVIEYFN